MLRTRRRALVLAAALAAAAAIITLRARPRGACVDQVEVAREPTGDVLFSWRARCPVTRLAVHRETATLWDLDGRITSPVRYGLVPRGAQGPAVPREPLLPGVTYHLELEYDEPSARTGLAIAQEFRLKPWRPAPCGRTKRCS